MFNDMGKYKNGKKKWDAKLSLNFFHFLSLFLSLSFSFMTGKYCTSKQITFISKGN